VNAAKSLLQTQGFKEWHSSSYENRNEFSSKKLSLL
jgi:hypothetical protein